MDDFHGVERHLGHDGDRGVASIRMVGDGGKRGAYWVGSMGARSSGAEVTPSGSPGSSSADLQREISERWQR